MTFVFHFTRSIDGQGAQVHITAAAEGPSVLQALDKVGAALGPAVVKGLDAARPDSWAIEMQDTAGRYYSSTLCIWCDGTGVDAEGDPCEECRGTGMGGEWTRSGSLASWG